MIDILLALPDHGPFTALDDSQTSDPTDILYTMRTRLHSGILKATLASTVFSTLLFKGRPLIMTYQTDSVLKFAKEALDSFSKKLDREQSDVKYEISDIDPIILECFSSLLSQ